ncbi:MAG TPA: protein-disulfide reductase DsbD domain-containing protein, partial [Spirochaetia bacterium]|nr:protein-disulfide reductase DsbD domain-containing protein [Spirochaetia bacterium]
MVGPRQVDDGAEPITTLGGDSHSSEAPLDIYYCQRKILSTRKVQTGSMTLILTILTALLASLFSPGLSAQARDVPSLGNFRTVTGGPVAAQLAADQAFVAPGKPFTAAVVLSMQPDWHVYWKYPGDSGLPTTVAWDLPPGFTAGPVQWPVPRRFIQDGLVTYGYPGRVLLLAEITPPATLAQDTPVVLRAHAEWLACRVECTPGKADLSLSLPVGSGPPMPDRAWTAAFDDARAHLPSTPDDAVFSASGDEKSITLAVTGPGFTGARFSFYPAADGLKVSAPQEVSGTAGSVRLRLAREPRVKAPDRLTGLLVSDEIGPVGETRAWTVDVPVKPGAAAGMGLISAILLAFIGGVILNLMPCVLPVISLKALALMRHGRDGAARSGLLFTLGVLVSFWVIAAVLEGLRAGGRLLGWGFQFQDPVTVLIAAVLFFLIGL